MVAAVALAGGGRACAGEVPLYRPAPAWVAVAPPIASLPQDKSIVVFDQQQRLADGQTWSYVDVARHIVSEQELLQAGTVSLTWQPGDGDLIIHEATLVRGTQTIDLLAEKGAFSVLRRELGLESLKLDGMLTATMAVKGLQIGDLLRLRYSITNTDPALAGRVQTVAALLPEQANVGFARTRLLWPASADVHWKMLSKVGTTHLGTSGGDRELTVAVPLPKQPEIPGDAPVRARPLPLVEASSFRDWPDVSRTMAPLFAATAPAAGSPLAAEVARIAAATPDPKLRAALALQSVQHNIRYLFNGLDHGNYTPQAAALTWTVRYGDCKAKTLLLLTLLAGLQIEAEPVLANLRLGDWLPERLPSAAAFDHILVAATIGGERYWLDGTGAGARAADLGDTPNLRHVLPLRRAGAGLLQVATHPNARANLVTAVDYDTRAGIGLPVIAKVGITVNGYLAEQLRTATNQIGGDKRKELIDGFVRRGGEGLLVFKRDLRFDEAAGTATVEVSGLRGDGWERDNQRYEWTLDPSVRALTLGGDRGRPEWRALPVATGGVQSQLRHLTVQLPDGGKGFELDGARTLPPRLAGIGTRRSVEMADGRVVIEDRLDETAAEIAPGEIAAARAALARAQTQALKLTAPRDYPRHWQVVQAARAGGRLQLVEAGFAAALADTTEKAPVYLARAQFRAGVFDRKGAVADLNQAVASRRTADALQLRATLHYLLGSDSAALADAKAAYDLDPQPGTLGPYVLQLAQTGQVAPALALLDDAIATGGERKAALQMTKANILATAGRAPEALAAADAAIATKPGNASLLNSRCWVKATLGVELPSALKDCSKALELGDSGAAALDSRALAYLKLNRLDDALTDVNAALDQRPDQAGSLYLRGVIERRQGARAASDLDLGGARAENPRIDDEYRRYQVQP